MQFNLIFGDWSGDGHSIKDEYSVDVTIPGITDPDEIRELLRKNYLQNTEKLGYGITALWDNPFEQVLLDLHRVFGVTPTVSADDFAELDGIFEGAELEAFKAAFEVAQPGEETKNYGIDICGEIYAEDMIPLSMELFLNGIEDATWRELEVKDYLFGGHGAIADDRGLVAYERYLY